MDITKFELPPSMQKQLDIVREKRNFDASKWVEQKCKMLNEYMSKSGLKGCVLNCSGGIDSSVTLALIKHASKMENSPIKRIIAIAQPIHSTASIQNKAYIISKHLDVEIFTIDQTEIFDKLENLCRTSTKLETSKFATGQLKSYMRTPVVYYVCQMLSSCGIPSIVMGTGNFDEDGYILYYCKAGDGVADVSLISDLHKREVYLVGHYLKLPEEILGAVPSADLWSGQTDEDELGFSYKFIELFTEYLIMSEEEQRKMREAMTENDLKQFDKWAEMAQKVHRCNLHKRNFPKTFPIYAYMDKILTI